MPNVRFSVRHVLILKNVSPVLREPIDQILFLNAVVYKDSMMKIRPQLIVRNVHIIVMNV